MSRGETAKRAAALSPGRIGRRERRKQEVRDRLIRAAEDCFRLHGIYATTVQQITEAADVGYGTFFNYFSSKEALFAEMGERHLECLRSVADRSRGLSIKERLKNTFLAGGRRFEERPELGRAMILEIMRRTTTPGLDNPGMRDQVLEVYTSLLEEGQDQDELRRDLDPRALAELIGGLFLSVLHQRLADPGGPTLEERVCRALDLLWEGIGPAPRNGS